MAMSWMTVIGFLKLQLRTRLDPRPESLYVTLCNPAEIPLIDTELTTEPFPACQNIMLLCDRQKEN